MRLFNFDPGEYRAAYAENDWVHIPNGVTPEFLEAMREFVTRSLTDNKVEGAGIGGKGRKDQAVFEFPDSVDFPGEAFDVVASMCGLDRDAMTLSERHVNSYYADAPSEPTAHKDRYSSQVSVGLSIESPPGSRVVLYPSEERSENPFNISFALIGSLHPSAIPIPPCVRRARSRSRTSPETSWLSPAHRPGICAVSPPGRRSST